MDFDIPSAAEARERIQNLEAEGLQNQQRLVAEAIKKALDEGKYATSVGVLSEAVIIWLQSLGYKISYGSQYNESYTSISWK